MNYLKNNFLIKTLNSKDYKTRLVKMSILLLFSLLSFIDVLFSTLTMFVMLLFSAFEFSFSSIVYFVCAIVLIPFFPYLSIKNMIVFYFALFLIKFIIDVVKKRFEIKDKKNLFILVTFAVMAVVLLIPITPHYDIKDVLTTVFGFGLLTLLILNIKEVDLKNLFTYFVIFVCISYVVYNFLNYFRLGGVENGYRYGDTLYRFILSHIDPNYTGGVLICALAVLLVLYKNSNIKKWLFYVLYFVLNVFLFNTISKAATICYIMLISYILIFLVIKSVKDKTQLKELLLFVLVTLISVLFSYKVVAALFSRFSKVADSDDKISTLTTGRAEIWIMYLKEIFSSWKLALFGHGCGANILDYADTHNLALSLMYYHGLVPVMLLICIFIFGFIKHVKKINIFSSYSSLSVLVMYMSLAGNINILFYVFFFVFTLFVYETETVKSEKLSKEIEEKNLLSDANETKKEDLAAKITEKRENNNN